MFITLNNIESGWSFQWRRRNSELCQRAESLNMSVLEREGKGGGGGCTYQR